jgi:hypothetical protein
MPFHLLRAYPKKVPGTFLFCSLARVQEPYEDGKDNEKALLLWKRHLTIIEGLWYFLREEWFNHTLLGKES